MDEQKQKTACIVWSCSDMQVHVIGVFVGREEAETMCRWYEALTNREGEYQVVDDLPLNPSIPPESEWPKIFESSGRKQKKQEACAAAESGIVAPVEVTR